MDRWTGWMDGWTWGRDCREGCALIDGLKPPADGNTISKDRDKVNKENKEWDARQIGNKEFCYIKMGRNNGELIDGQNLLIIRLRSKYYKLNLGKLITLQ